MIDDTTARIAKRLVQTMISFATNDSLTRKQGMDTFKGLGFALAMVYEETTGNSANNRKPKELMQWAINLAEPKKTLVTLD